MLQASLLRRFVRGKNALTIKYAFERKNPAKFDHLLEIYTLFTHFLVMCYGNYNILLELFQQKGEKKQATCT